MKGKTKKYLSEFSFNMFSSKWMMIPASQINTDGEMPVSGEEIAKNCHIYLIAKLPSLYINKETFLYKDGVISGHLNYKVIGVEKTIPINFKFPLIDDAVYLKLSDYPHREINTYKDGDRHIYSNYPTII